MKTSSGPGAASRESGKVFHSTPCRPVTRSGTASVLRATAASIDCASAAAVGAAVGLTG